MTYVPIGILVDRAVPQKHVGIVYATLTSGAAIGFIVLSPAWVFAQEYFDWWQVFFAVGLTFLRCRPVLGSLWAELYGDGGRHIDIHAEQLRRSKSRFGIWVPLDGASTGGVPERSTWRQRL